jgi:hypothetical protein
MKITKKKHIFRCTCLYGRYDLRGYDVIRSATELVNTLIADENPIRVHHYCTFRIPKSGKSEGYRETSIYKVDKDHNIVFKDLKAKSLQRKVHPEEEEGFGLYYVYTYDEVPREDQLKHSALEYVCYEEVEVDINPGTVVLPQGKSKFVNWQSKNKGGSVKTITNSKPLAVKDNKYFKKIKEPGFTRPNMEKKEIKPQILGLYKKEFVDELNLSKENDVEPKND